MVDKGFLCYDTRLFESVHSFDDIHIDKAVIFYYFQQFIFVDDFLWYSCDVEFHILWIWESIVEVNLFYIGQDKFCCWGGNDTV